MPKLKFSPYSFSKIAKFKQCRMAFKFKYVLKQREPVTSIHLEKGDYCHLLIEHVLKGEIKNFKDPIHYIIVTKDNLKEYRQLVLNFCKGESFAKVLRQRDDAMGTSIRNPHLWEVERAFALGLNMKPCDAFALNPNSMIRGKIDFCVRDEVNREAHIYDWKTGKLPSPEYPKDEDQLDLYALWFFKRYEWLENIHSSFVFIEHDAEQSKNYTRDDIDPIERRYLEYIREIESEMDFQANESALCKYCEYLHCCPSYQSVVDDRCDFDLLLHGSE